jgi:hypothetical protein
LQRVPFDKIKIDQSFVRGANEPESRKAALIRAMVGLAHDLEMQTTAEGVETQDELVLVRKLGVSLIQGYIFGKPMPAEEARKLATEKAPVSPDGFQKARESRLRIIRAALLHYAGDVKGARLRNISSGGALVECREPVPVGSEIQLDFAVGGLIEAKVAWVKGDNFGVQFKKRFDLKLLKAIEPARKSAKVMTPTYLSARSDSEPESKNSA